MTRHWDWQQHGLEGGSGGNGCHQSLMMAGAKRGHLAGATPLRSTATTRTREKMGRRRAINIPNSPSLLAFLHPANPSHYLNPHKARGEGAWSVVRRVQPPDARIRWKKRENGLWIQWNISSRAEPGLQHSLFLSPETLLDPAWVIYALRNNNAYSRLQWGHWSLRSPKFMAKAQVALVVNVNDITIIPIIVA